MRVAGVGRRYYSFFISWPTLISLSLLIETDYSKTMKTDNLKLILHNKKLAPSVFAGVVLSLGPEGKKGGLVRTSCRN